MHIRHVTAHYCHQFEPVFFPFQSRPSVLFSRSLTTATGRFVKIHTTSQRTATSHAIMTSCPRETAARRPTRTQTADKRSQTSVTDQRIIKALLAYTFEYFLLKLFFKYL